MNLVMDTKATDNSHLIGKTVSIHSDQDLHYWCEVLQCDQQDLIQSVIRIGNSAKMVDDYLILNRRKKQGYGR